MSAGNRQQEGVDERPGYWLESVAGSRHFIDSVATIGRAPENDIRVDSRIISRYHALLRSIAGEWILTDLDSTNGTRLNGNEISTPQTVRPNDVIDFADARFLLRSTDQALDVAVSIVLQAREVISTEHFVLRFRKDSFADQHRGAIIDRVERSYAILAGLLGIADLDQPIEVFLVNELADPQQRNATLLSGGYAEQVNRTIYEVYRGDAPGVDLDRSLLDVLRYVAFGPGVKWPPALTEALLILVDQHMQERYAAEQVPSPLADAVEQETLPPLSVLLDRESEFDRGLRALALAHFIEFLVAEVGSQRVSQFLRALGHTDANSAARQATGRSLDALEKRWRKHLKSEVKGGVKLFLSLVIPYLRPYWLKLSELTIYILISVAFGIILAKSQGYLFDKALLQGDRHLFGIVMIGLVVLFIISNLSGLRESYVKAWVGERVAFDVRGSLYRHVQGLHPGYFSRADSGDLITRLTSDITTIQFAMTQGMVEFLRLSIMFVAAMLTIVLTEWRLAILALIGAPFFLITGRFLGPPVARASITRQEDYASMTVFLHESLAVRSVMTLFGLQRLMSERFQQRLEAVFNSSIRMNFLGGVYVSILGATASGVELAVLGIGGYLILDGNMTPGDLVTFLFLIGLVIGPLQSFSNILQLIQQATGSMQRIDELASSRSEIADVQDAVAIGSVRQEIRLESVTFGYERSEPILKDISMVIPAGSSVAIVGPSGSGKSTVFNLLTRSYDPQLGRVMFDGVDLRASTLESIRSQIGMVQQDNVLLKTSIHENIQLGNLGASDEMVIAAARAAEIHEFIERLPDGYDTDVGERGGLLSGGQRQRVAIARAIIRDPALLFLDEATSALDAGTEAAINATLRRVARGRTTVTVTHRLASITEVDTIFVLESGRLVEQGTHTELLKFNGIYRDLWREQEGGTADPTIVQTMADIENLRRVPIFSELDRELLTRLVHSGEIEIFSEGAEIVTQGGIGDRLYVIRNGDVDVLANSDGSMPRRLARLHAGDFFGEIALLQDAPRTATVKAVSTVETFSLGKHEFLSLMSNSPRLREAVTNEANMREEELRALMISEHGEPPAAIDA